MDQVVVANSGNTERVPEQVGNGNQGPSQGSVREKCCYFLKGVCRHGFSGKVERDGKLECLFSHPLYVRNIWTRDQRDAARVQVVSLLM